MIARILNLLIALDQFLFCLVTLGGSNPDETLSAAAWRWDQKGLLTGKVLRQVIDTLLFFDSKHCQRSFESELQRKHLHPKYREGLPM